MHGMTLCSSLHLLYISSFRELTSLPTYLSYCSQLTTLEINNYCHIRQLLGFFPTLRPPKTSHCVRWELLSYRDL